MSGTFPRLIGRYVREDKLMNLVEAVRKISILPAQRFGIKNVGSIEPGKNADIVLFDYDTIIDRADFVNRGDPGAPPDGIKYVIINGHTVVKDNAIDTRQNYGSLII